MISLTGNSIFILILSLLGAILARIAGRAKMKKSTTSTKDAITPITIPAPELELSLFGGVLTIVVIILLYLIIKYGPYSKRRFKTIIITYLV